MGKRGQVPHRYEEITQATAPTSDFLRPLADGPTGADPSGRELAARVEAALLSDPRLVLEDLRVLAHGSRIILLGTAIGPGTAAYAQDVARRVPGVTEVTNELSIVH